MAVQAAGSDAASVNAKVHAVPLTQLARGTIGVVLAVDARDESVLGAMGLRDRSSVRVCRLGEPCIVEVGCAPGMCRRIGLSRSVAQRVIVEPAPRA